MLILRNKMVHSMPCLTCVVGVQDDETTLLEEEELANAEHNNPVDEVRSCISNSFTHEF